MPVQGPGNNEGRAQLAYEEIEKLLHEKYHIFNVGAHFSTWPGSNSSEEMQVELNKLKTVIYEIFRIDSWDSW